MLQDELFSVEGETLSLERRNVPAAWKQFRAPALQETQAIDAENLLPKAAQRQSMMRPVNKGQLTRTRSLVNTKNHLVRFVTPRHQVRVINLSCPGEVDRPASHGLASKNHFHRKKKRYDLK